MSTADAKKNRLLHRWTQVLQTIRIFIRTAMTNPSSNEHLWETNPFDLTAPQPSNWLTQSRDFTVYWENGAADPPDIQLSTLTAELHDERSINKQVKLKLPGPEPNIPVEARACICYCYKQRFVSGTFRCSKEKPDVTTTLNYPKWWCSTWSSYDPAKKDREFPVETITYVKAMWNLIHPSASEGPLTGLIVFSGSTNAAKSELAKAFALEAVHRAVIDRATNGKKDDRLPHLVSYEDPIESWKLSTQDDQCTSENEKDSGRLLHDAPGTALDFGFCFTPREKSTDVESLEDALSDAKRQTPTCFYIGEVRDRSEWKQIIEFAGTGHLVVATTHAARLSETVARILRANDAETPAARRNVGGNLTACIHLQSGEVTCEGSKKKVVLPTMWIRRGSALSSLVADGLSSVTPNGDYDLSKYQFLKNLFADNTPAVHGPSVKLRDALLGEAIRLDALDLLQ